MSLSMKNIIAAYNIKNRDGIMTKWDSDRLECNRLQRLAEVRAAVHTGRPPRPQASGQAVPFAPVRAASAGSRRQPGRARSASAYTHRSHPAHVPAQHPPEVNADAGDARLDPLFMLSPGSRERDAQQYMTGTEEAAALRAEMEDWYFAPSTASSARRPRAEPTVEPVAPAMDVHNFENLAAAAWKPCPAPAEARRRSPYAADLVGQRCGRPRSTPPCPPSSQQTRNAANAQARQAPHSRQSSKSRERETAPGVSDPVLPPIDLLTKAASQVPWPQPPLEAKPATENHEASSDVIARGSCEVYAPVHTHISDSGTPVGTGDRGTPDLRSAQAINDWVAQAQQRMASVFADAPKVDGEIKQTSPPAATVATVADAHSVTQRMSSPVTSSTDPADANIGKSSPTTSSADTADANIRETEASFAAKQMCSTPKVQVGIAASATATVMSESEHFSEDASADPADANIRETESSFAAKQMCSTPKVQVGIAASATATVMSESEHFSEDAFEEAEADDGDVSFDASALSAGVVDLKGSDASFSFDAAVPASGTGIAGARVGITSAEHIEPNASSSCKVGVLSATNASLSYDDDFEAADADEEETLGASGASMGGA